MNAAKEFLFDNALTVAVETGAEIGKEVLKETVKNELVELGGNFMIDMVGSSIPGIGGAISSYKTNKKIKNLSRMLVELNQKHDELKTKFDNHSLENREVLDDIFAMVIEKISATWQEEKIEYMINGYSELLNIDNPSFDTAYLYFDTLDRLTILDIAVLKVSHRTKITWYGEQSNLPTGEEIRAEFDISQSQYVAVQQNLLRMGLLENEYDSDLVNDLDTIDKAIKEIKATTESLVNIVSEKRGARLRKLTNKSNVKLKAKDRLKISNFGTNLLKFFMEEELER